jgi:hypothetical protein
MYVVTVCINKTVLISIFHDSNRRYLGEGMLVCTLSLNIIALIEQFGEFILCSPRLPPGIDQMISPVLEHS